FYRFLFRQDASMGTDALTIVFIPVHCAPKKAPCPKCGKLGKRKRTCTREVRTVAFKAVAYLKITYGEYTARCECCTTFRNTPEGVLPKAHYDNKVRDLVLDRIIKDGMSIERILGKYSVNPSPALAFSRSDGYSRPSWTTDQPPCSVSRPCGSQSRNWHPSPLVR